MARCKSAHLTNVRIFAVAEDGTETPVLGWEEALAKVEALQAEVASLRARPAPLTVEEAEQIARTFADGLGGFDIPEDVETLTNLFVRISRGEGRTLCEGSR